MDRIPITGSLPLPVIYVVRNKSMEGITKPQRYRNHILGPIPDRRTMRRLHDILHFLQRSTDHASNRQHMGICKLYRLKRHSRNCIGWAWLLHWPIGLDDEKTQNQGSTMLLSWFSSTWEETNLYVSLKWEIHFLMPSVTSYPELN